MKNDTLFSRFRGFTQVRRFSRLAKEFKVPRLPNFPVPRFIIGLGSQVHFPRLVPRLLTRSQIEFIRIR